MGVGQGLADDVLGFVYLHLAAVYELPLDLEKRQRGPYNFRDYKAVKHGRNNPNDFVYRIGKITNDNKPAVRAAAGAQAFSNVNGTLSQITMARVADHSRHLLPAARNALPGVTIWEKNFGANPYYRAGWVTPRH
ncbi:hypothetical protein C8A05DRAFT_34549 [Staphylotrichum tortipilum]|uniref:Uncharacterized protein n=1 Tax=Staphylotrichum tortipilum TaxID=2831512 RepID=A0AAN6MK83_9PEZI|nr:hypothetical protein C8A05DRAFT_34549 [Staphylotrichum longicolle]